MSVDSNQLQKLLASAGEFSTVLEDPNVKYMIVAPNGEWSFLKLGRTREGQEPADAAWLAELSVLVATGATVRHREWAIRRFDGVGGSSFLIERVPTAVVDRLPQTVVDALKRQIRRDGNGLLVGHPGSSKGAILLWMAMQIPEEHVLYVSENPPNELPGSHILHVFPPDDSAQRRNLERLARLNQTVIWDRVAGPRDIHTLFGFPGARRRWFSLDASSVKSCLRALAGYMNQGVDARFDTVVSIQPSVIGRPEVQNLLVRSDDGWHEIFHADQPALELIQAFANQRFEAIGGLVQRSEPEAFGNEPRGSAPAAQSDVGLEQDSMAGIRKRPGRMTTDFENPLTIPVEEEPSDLEAHPLAAQSHERLDELRSSGEIDLQGFVNRRDEDRDTPHLPEETRQYDQRVDDARTSAADPALLDEILPRADDEEEPPDAVNLEDLRITRAEEIHEETLEAITSAKDESHGFEESDGDTSSVHYDSIPREALQPLEDSQPEDSQPEDLMDYDFGIDEALDDAWSEASYDDPYEEMEEVSGMISAEELESTSVAGAADYATFTAEDPGFEPDPDTSPTRTAGADLAAAIARANLDASTEDATTELTVEKLMKLRNENEDH